jgi:HAD superfamily hydrolase (TIGR01509 family)
MKNFALDIRDKVLLFDFDGTLVETEFLAQRVIEEYFSKKQSSYRAPSELIIGRTWQAAIESMMEHALAAGAEIDSHETLLTAFKSAYQDLLHNGVNLIPGFLECLPHLKEQARYLGIVTGSAHEEVETVLNGLHLKHYFERVWAYGDYEKSKPDPSPYLTAIRALNVKPEDVIVFEDSVAGMESATRAGLRFVQVCHEGHAKDPDPRALLVMKDWTDLWKP